MSLIKQHLHQLQTMNDQDLQKLKENYCEMIIDSLDMDSLIQMCYDLLMDSYKDCTWDEVTEEIVDLYDEDMLIELIPEPKK